MNNAGKGSRQNRPVTSGKGLALVGRRNNWFVLMWGSAADWGKLWQHDFVLDGSLLHVGMGRPSSCSELELQRAKGIRLFN